ncbi:MAG: bactoprenol glucosyl transferase [Planctomycetes bacterium RBG_16_43_13]|nr:MAG: bactoprenol glucosyl transferase [Planctomycetes bacterium RBG_16_43_13]
MTALQQTTYSMVVPMYNERENIRPFYNRVSKVLEDMGESYEIICVNDGSRDDTLDILLKLHSEDPRVKVIDLSRNFGKEIALTAGIDRATGDAVIPIDADLQDPPELIPQLVTKWKEGYDVVYATRLSREGESIIKRMSANLFYRFINRLTKIEVPKDTGDFRLMSRQVVEALKELREHHRFMKGLFSWVGFRQIGIPYHREARFAGRTKWNYWKLWNFSLEGITAFSYIPLQLASCFGMLVALFGFLFGLYLITDTLILGNPVKGYPSLMVVILFLGGVQLITLGIIGEYVGRTYNESKRRPLYYIRNAWGKPFNKQCLARESVTEEVPGKQITTE